MDIKKIKTYGLWTLSVWGWGYVILPELFILSNHYEILLLEKFLLVGELYEYPFSFTGFANLSIGGIVFILIPYVFFFFGIGLMSIYTLINKLKFKQDIFTKRRMLEFICGIGVITALGYFFSLGCLIYMEQFGSI